MTLALVRPSSWNPPLFLHLLGAMTLVGTLLAVTILAGAARRRDAATAALLRRLALRSMLFVGLPAFVVMRVAAQWLESRENVSGSPTWLGIGFAVADPGLIVLIVLTLLVWRGARRSAGGDKRSAAGAAAAIVAPLYLVALAVAWWAMTTKPGA